MVNKLELPVMWSMALESMTQLEEEDIRHVSGLPDPASAEKVSYYPLHGIQEKLGGVEYVAAL